MAKYKVLVTGIVLTDGTLAPGNTEVDESKILGDIDYLVKGKFIAPSQAKTDVKAPTKKQLTDYTAKFGADAPEGASQDAVKSALDSGTVIAAEPDSSEDDEPVV